jgi:hypothetical protein
MYIQRGAEVLAGGQARCETLAHAISQWNGEMRIVL